jgi:hypothetical protein
MKIRSSAFIIILILISVIVMACNLPFMATPTPFVFPTVDQTMTALFQPTEPQEPTSTPISVIIETALPADTEEPTEEPTETPTQTPSPIPPTPIPPNHRSGPQTEALYVKHQPEMDGGWGDWDAEEYSANSVVYGRDNWKGSDDLSSTYKVQWDEDYLYIAWKVTDDKYVQESRHEDMYMGDSVEVLIDTAVQYDYWQRWLDWDDYQIGFSPGSNEIGERMEAYLWFPRSKEGTLSKAIYGVKKLSNGYRVTLGIPWKTLGVEPYTGMRLGFAASVSDDDSKKGGEQQTMVSSTSKRVLTDPTTWGDLILVK